MSTQVMKHTPTIYGIKNEWERGPIPPNRIIKPKGYEPTNTSHLTSKEYRELNEWRFKMSMNILFYGSVFVSNAVTLFEWIGQQGPLQNVYISVGVTASLSVIKEVVTCILNRKKNTEKESLLPT